jgi:Flp pilus assembly protein TadB
MGQKASKSVAEEVDKTKEQIDAAYNVFKKAEEFQCRDYDADGINMKMLNVFILSFILFCIVIYIYLLFRTRKK